MSIDTIITLVLIIVLLYGTTGYLLYRCLTAKPIDLSDDQKESVASN